MYTCGQTVYNDMHVGNARFYVVFDVVRRYLEYRGYAVRSVQNFTDVDDKIIARARDEGRDAGEIAETYIRRTLEDLESLNVLPATADPRATGEMPEIIEMITQLIKAGTAYERGGSVYFDTACATGYGKLSRKNPDDLLAGARVEVDANKRSPADFILWKPAKPGEPFWESPWGNGRPGWHIECSAMARKYVGDEIDIHGGATDLIFPHHENEIAQTEALTGKPFVRYWMHCGIITVDHKKMSKSRGNFQTLREVAERFPYDVIRFYLIGVNYRMPMEFGDEMIAAAGRGLERIRNCYQSLKRENGSDDVKKPRASWEKITVSHQANFHKALTDDFNTADAVTAIFELVKHINTGLAAKAFSLSMLEELREQLAEMCGLLGIDLDKPEVSSNVGSIDAAFIESRIAARQAARAAKNFTEADRIRNELAERGIILEDTPEGVRWKRA
jgi:cysteinyl-tRNA synthetase